MSSQSVKNPTQTYTRPEETVDKVQAQTSFLLLAVQIILLGSMAGFLWLGLPAIFQPAFLMKF
jgi:hypothetical protein